MSNRLKEWRRQYNDIPIPTELDDIIESALTGHTPQKHMKKRWIWPTSIVAAASIFTATVNFSPQAAKAMSEVPILKQIIEVITIDKIHEEQESKSIDVEIPEISGLENHQLETHLNQAFLEKGKQLYQEYTDSNGHLAIQSDYSIVNENNQILSIELNTFKAEASGYEQKDYLTIDKKLQTVITLPSLFTSEAYVEVISEEIKKQMKQNMANDENLIYWLDDVESFTTINRDQPFFINEDNHLIISFDEYEVAPGYMGVVQFEIPTEIINEILVSDHYIN
ncbi:DUF3298 and DUF4163 domain-containing protein [Cytobacillus kochii]|uniref:DUF3298 and DUF4163 domain-containing protein n=1 Tax=Cytobacillus kochii TaxID=859143 RepID=UPI0020402014|nr:DUF3298 and DUF4163 domain-containing protein [Cytobacillus kochii]MCM3323663.1 DUF3298 and DUF4163 domain-containing protein [Cytobacillus kochii]MCM3346156.1 DUF3298 and DUF4163 domain-containing protein [Cytobacillus kochii]